MQDTKIDTTAIAKELLAKNILNDPGFSIKELFAVRDACLQLARFGLEDKELLQETLKYISDKVGE